MPLNITSYFKRRKLTAAKALAEATEREALAIRNEAAKDAHVDAQLMQLSTAPKGQRRFEMITPPGYAGKARAAGDTSAASVVAAVKDGVESLRAENSNLKTRIQNLESAQAAKAETPPAPDMVKLAAVVFGDDQIESLKSNVGSAQLSERCERLFHMNGLSDLLPINVEAMRRDGIEPMKIHGMGRITHAALRSKTQKALATAL